MTKKLKTFLLNHPYLPLLFMAALDMAGYVIEGFESGEVVSFDAVVGRLRTAFSSLGNFVEFFPEEIFVAITAYSLGQKMIKLNEDHVKASIIVGKLEETGDALRDIWKSPPQPSDSDSKEPAEGSGGRDKSNKGLEELKTRGQHD